jgi:hypothetical protein
MSVTGDFTLREMMGQFARAMNLDVRHVHPTDDDIDHELQGVECACGPRLVYEDGTRLIVVHHSLDGREGGE